MLLSTTVCTMYKCFVVGRPRSIKPCIDAERNSLFHYHAGDAQAQVTTQPARLQRRALRGLAQIAGAKGDAVAAEQLYRRILSPAADLPAHQQPMQQVPAALSALEHILGAAPSQAAPAPAAVGEHWAHGDYGWLLFEQGRIEVPPHTAPGAACAGPMPAQQTCHPHQPCTGRHY